MLENNLPERWTWKPTEHPRVGPVLSASQGKDDWPDDLEMAASDAVTGKVLCVIAGIAIARAVITKLPGTVERQAEAMQLLELADAWIDDPTVERFDQITAFLFDDEREHTEPNDPLNVVWGALRIVSSSVGNYEAGWALGMVVDDAMHANLDAVEIARMALEARAA